MISIKDCQRLGTIKKEESFSLNKLKKNIEEKNSIKTKMIVSLVILKSKKPK